MALFRPLGSIRALGYGYFARCAQYASARRPIAGGQYGRPSKTQKFYTYLRGIKLASTLSWDSPCARAIIRRKRMPGRYLGFEDKCEDERISLLRMVANEVYTLWSRGRKTYLLYVLWEAFNRTTRHGKTRSRGVGGDAIPSKSECLGIGIARSTKATTTRRAYGFGKPKTDFVGKRSHRTPRKTARSLGFVAFYGKPNSRQRKLGCIDATKPRARSFATKIKCARK